MIASAASPLPEIATEAIVVIDLVESTLTSNLFGWYAVGRHSLRDLRALIGAVGAGRGLRCLKNTGDGYLLTFHDPQSAEMAAVRSVEAMFDLLNRIADRNSVVSEERALNLRCSVHLGEVDVVADDREGPHVSLAFRLQEISRASLPAALNPIPPEQFPLLNYVLCSEEVAGILERRASPWQMTGIGLFKLKGFPGWREVFRLLPEERAIALGAAFPPGFLDELRSRVPLGDLVGRRVRLTRRGREQAGLCPFHNEKTPSFYIVEDKGFFHCFGCGAHGDAIGFLMRADNLDFIEAVQRLAGEAGIEVPQQTPQEREQARRQKTC